MFFVGLLALAAAPINGAAVSSSLRSVRLRPVNSAAVKASPVAELPQVLARPVIADALMCVDAPKSSRGAAVLVRPELPPPKPPDPHWFRACDDHCMSLLVYRMGRHSRKRGRRMYPGSYYLCPLPPGSPALPRAWPQRLAFMRAVSPWLSALFTNSSIMRPCICQITTPLQNLHWH